MKTKDAMDRSCSGRLDYELGMAEDRNKWRRHMVGEAKIHLEIVWPEE